MRILFAILSIAYIAGIFILANSPIVSILSAFNPYSLLHIPLYGILTFLLIFTLIPIKMSPMNSTNPSTSSNPIRGYLRIHFFLAGGIALAVAIADEIYQSHVPGRDASVTDVFLDLFGIVFVLFLFSRFLKTKALGTR